MNHILICLLTLLFSLKIIDPLKIIDLFISAYFLPRGSDYRGLDKATVIHQMNHVKTATVRELRNEFPRIEAWVHEGESVNISKRGKVIATLVPVLSNAGVGTRVPKPDIMARLRETWGERVFTVEEVATMREDELAADLG